MRSIDSALPGIALACEDAVARPVPRRAKTPQERAVQFARRGSPWLIASARFGHAAKGLVYVLLGAMTFIAALTPRRPSDSKGVLAAILAQPHGQVLLGLVAIGLFAYAAWQVLRAVADPEGVGGRFHGIARRAAWLVTGITHAAIGVAAARLLVGTGGRETGDDDAQAWTATLMAQPFGRWLVIALGVVVIAGAARKFHRAWRERVDADLAVDHLTARARCAIVGIGRAGFGAQGVVLLTVGVFLVIAAVRFDPDEARGLGGALAALEQQPYGAYLLAIVGVGFVAHGVFELVRAWFRDFRAPAGW